MKQNNVSYDRKIVLALLRKDKEIEMLREQIDIATQIIAELRSEK